MKNSIRVAICVMLVVAVLAMSLSVFAVDEGDRIVSAEYLWAYYIYVFLDSIGIDVTYQGVIGYVDEVQDTIIDWVVEYIADLIEADSQPSNYSIAQWIAPWQAGYDYWGNLQFNSTMLEDMEDFADWLKSELGLINDDIIVINPVYSIAGYNLYNCNQWYAVDPNGRQIVNMKVSDTSQPVYYFIANITSAYHRGYRYVLVSPNVGGSVNNNTWVQFVDTTTTPVMQSGNATLDHYRTQNFYHSDDYGCWEYDGQWLIPSGGSYFVGTHSELLSFISTAVIQADGDINVITGQMAFPADNPDYSDGDGVTIIDGVPQYGEVTFSGIIENLPAIVSTGTVTNPGLDTFWGFIPVLAEQTKDAIVLTRGLIYELPEELVVTFYAVMGGLILFGVIKLMREH